MHLNQKSIDMDVADPADPKDESSVQMLKVVSAVPAPTKGREEESVEAFEASLEIDDPAGIELDITAATPIEAVHPEECESSEAPENKIKRLPPSVLKDIELKNQARRLADLAPIKVRVRRCMACSQQFESAGNRTCGCNTRTTGYIAGREII